MRRLLRNRLGLLGLFILAALAVTGICAPWIIPYQIDDQRLLDALQGPSRDHWFGTDELGRDIFSRVVWGIRYTGLIPLAGVLLGAVVGTILGILAGYFGGKVETAAMGFVDTIMTFPSMVIALVAVTVIGAGIRGLIVAIAFATLAGPARIARGATLAVRELEFVQASRAIGSRDARILFRHVLPNIFSPIIVQTTLELSQGVLLSAALGFLGLGVQPPVPELGTMLSQARTYLSIAPHMMIFPGLFIALLVLGLNLAGDAIRDLLDPKMQKIF